MYRSWLVLVSIPVAASLVTNSICDADDQQTWSGERAASYLDTRAKAWFEWSVPERGNGATKSSCICCHTLVPYAVARPVLRKFTNETNASEYETRLLEQTRMRVQRWNDLDTDGLELLYDFSPVKKDESWGTEAVLNAFVLAFDDAHRGRPDPSEDCATALKNLWERQSTDGDNKGSWPWLDFDLEPWESKGARYFGASLAAVAVGTAPGYLDSETDEDVKRRVGLLRTYLRDKLGSQNLYNKLWALWASQALDDVLSDEQQRDLIEALLERQEDDGGWRLSALGEFDRQDSVPDGYATGLVVHVLFVAGVDGTDARMAKGVKWLRTKQSDTGAWYASSLNKDRDLTTHVGKFMSDAATAYSVMALSHVDGH